MASKLDRYHEVTIPPNLIATNCKTITPEMLPLINLNQAEIDAIIAQVPGGVANIQDIYGLAPLQSGMLFHHIKAERGDPYLIVNRLRFADRLTLQKYTAALQQVTERHDILRSAFIWEGLNEPVQVVLRQVPPLLTEITLNDAGEIELEQLSNRFDPRHYRLNLIQPPLLRLLAASTSEDGWVALRLMHHIIGDKVTMERLEVEVHAIMEGKFEDLTKPAPFRDFVAQLGINSSEHTRFFAEMLGDIDEPTLPFGLRDVNRDGTEIIKAYLTLPKTLSEWLREQSHRLRVTLASVCHLVWAQVLSRASGREAVVFGTVLLGRLQSGEGNNNINR